ncbi:hypothetical protein BC835DRAFT_1417940 [Cytidiella melzeri]|nr:hypothetical protein BC835DRAFT_1417940 [Cytidiella melzeri]
MTSIVMPVPTPQLSLATAQDTTLLTCPTDVPKSSLELSLESLVLTDPPEEWIKHAQATGFQRIVIVAAIPSETIFDGLEPYLARHPEVCQHVCEIEFAGAPNTHFPLCTDILYSILRKYAFPNLQSLTFRNLIVIETAPDDIGTPPDKFYLPKLNFVNISDIMASALLWIIGRFWGIEHLTLNGVAVLRGDQSLFPLERVYTAWTFADVARLPLPQLAKVKNLEIDNSCTSRFYVNFLRNTPSIQTLESISIGCAYSDDLLALGSLISEARGTLKNISVNISDCTRFGVNTLENTEATEHYLNALQSCTSLEKLTIEFYLSSNNFQLNDAAWIVAAHSFRCSPHNSVCSFNIKFSAGYDAELSSVAFENLNREHTNHVWPQWPEPDTRPTSTLAANNGFDDTQRTITTFEWLSLLPWLMCAERDQHLDGELFDSLHELWG